jgi:hypothetical protein
MIESDVLYRKREVMKLVERRDGMQRGLIKWVKLFG